MNKRDKLYEKVCMYDFYTSRLDCIIINLGNTCVQQGYHCQNIKQSVVLENMQWSVMNIILDSLSMQQPYNIELRGCSPLSAPGIKSFIIKLRQQKHNITLKLPPSVFTSCKSEITPESLAELNVNIDIIIGSSLPLISNYSDSDLSSLSLIKTLKLLNSSGYSVNPDLQLNLIFTPIDSKLFPDPKALELQLKEMLNKLFNLSFDTLHIAPETPLKRFKKYILSRATDTNYIDVLKLLNRSNTIKGPACLNELYFKWDGSLYNCEYNSAIDLPVISSDKLNKEELLNLLTNPRPVITGEHCCCCTAGSKNDLF